MKYIPHASLLLLAHASGGNIDLLNRYAYDTNAGWINFAPPVPTAVTIGDHFIKGHAYASNFGWISFGSGPANLASYTNSGTDHGVNVNPATGALTGRAWSANTGWISFGWASGNDPNRARVNLVNGTFDGWAWSPNTGWLSLSTLKATDLAISDTDSDGIDDAWEITHFGNLTTAGIGTDWDQDGQSDAAEFIAGTLPKDRTSWLRIVSHSVNGGKTTTTLTFTSSPVRLYQVESSTTLTSWALAPTAHAGSAKFPGTADASVTTVTCTHPTGPARFHRIVASKY